MTTNDIAMRVEGLGKEYRVGELAPYQTLRDSIASLARRPLAGRGDDAPRDERLWALRDVSFELRRGEVLGVIGCNGAGKSTLLKILSRITEPTVGRAVVHGRVGSLLEVGTGFHPELTGRENVYLNGAILGMSRREIAARFDAIVDFAEVSRFLDTPVKRYSSGMRVRLGFAVAAHLEPEILVVDEVLAVGDVAFQRKCLGKMNDAARSGRTVLFVSHNMAAVNNLCSRAILLESGRVVADGGPDEIIRAYLDAFGAVAGERRLDAPDVAHSGSGEARLVSARITDARGEPVTSVPMGEGITVQCDVEARDRVQHAAVAINIYDSAGVRLCAINSHAVRGFTFERGPGEHATIHCAIPRMNLSPGRYTLSLSIPRTRGTLIDHVEQALAFEVVPADVFGTGRTPWGRTVMFLDADWEMAA